MPRTTQTRGKGRTLAPRSAGVEGNNPARGPAAVDAGAPVPPGMPGKLQDLRPAPYNPREISPEAMAALGAGLSRFGDLSGIVWNKATGHVVSGHQRLERARKDGGRLVVRGAQAQVVVKGARGYEVPVRVVDWPLEMEKAANLAANNPASQGRFTPAVLHLVAELTDLDLDLSQELRLGDIATALGPDPLEDTPAAQDMAAAPSAAAEAAPVEADRKAVEALCGVRFPCNEALADHPTVQVCGGGVSFEVGFVGLLNGAIEPATGERVAYVPGSTPGSILKFVVYAAPAEGVTNAT